MKTAFLFVAIIFMIALYPVHEAKVHEGNKVISEEKADPSPGAPKDLRLVMVPDGFKLSWNASPDSGDIMGYEILRSANIAGGPYILIGKVGKDVSEYFDETAIPENIYYYKIRAVSGDKYSSYSNTVAGER